MITSKNAVELCGVAGATPEISHSGKNELFYTFPIIVQRLSGAEDVINVIVREALLDDDVVREGNRIKVTGELRSFNNKSGFGNKLVITVFARRIERTGEDNKNVTELAGTICKQPTLRITPMGREICDIMLAVNRKYGRSDYLPCITWGKIAKKAAQWEVGTRVELTGRLQSRKYIKTIDGVSMEKTAYEVSAASIERAEDTEEAAGDASDGAVYARG